MENLSSVSADKIDTSENCYNLSKDEILSRFESSEIRGLSKDEAKMRLSKYGPNEIEVDKGLTKWQILVHQFKDPLIYILLIAAFITLVLQDYVDSGVIMAVVLINALIGYIQETKAQQAILALSGLAAPKAHVIRDGREMIIPSRGLVPGDVVLLSSGGRVAADMRILSANSLDVNESALTGESMVVRKESKTLNGESLVPGDRTNMLFSGTIVAQGRAKAVVVRTGASTEIGKIATSVKQIGITRTPLQKKVDALGNKIGLLIAAFSVLIAIIGIWHQMDPGEIFITVVAMAVSAIPEGLPVVLTVTLAIGVKRMARRQAIIRSLPAVETLGSTTVIGSDKTGTLTKNEMTVRRIWTDQQFYTTTETGYSLKGNIAQNESEIVPETKSGLYETLLAGTLANEADTNSLLENDPNGDPTEIALHVSAFKGGLLQHGKGEQMPMLDLIPFEPELQYMATIHQLTDGNRVFLKGSPEVVMEKCQYMVCDGQLVELEPEDIRSAARDLGEEGLRVLAMAYKPTDHSSFKNTDLLENEFIFAGLQGMEDPIRPEAIEAVQISQKAGVRVVMITGDHIDTARSIGNKLGLDPHGHGALEGVVLDQLSDEELDLKLRDINIFARVSPSINTE